MAKRALLIGINQYQIAGADLRGCVNDVQDLAAALVEFYGFNKKDITTLTDAAATKKAMQAGIAALVRDSKKGDVAVLHYSGHGSNVPDDNDDEADGRDEILCPTDLDWKDPMRDDWLRSTLDGMKDGVNFTAIMDCCHSGTNTRAFLPPSAAFVGRDRALAELRAQLQSALTGHGQVAVVQGEGGVGKTRLLQELLHEARQHGASGPGRGAGQQVASKHSDVLRSVKLAATLAGRGRPIQRGGARHAGPPALRGIVPGPAQRGR